MHVNPDNPDKLKNQSPDLQPRSFSVKCRGCTGFPCSPHLSTMWKF